MSTSAYMQEQVVAKNTDKLLIKDANDLKIIKRDTFLKREGYEDLRPTGEYSPGGASDPSVKTFIAPLLIPAFAGSGTNNQATYRFHFPHDLVPGSDFYMHVHWGNNQVSPSGNVKWKITWRYARGYELGDFGTEIVTILPDATVNATQYKHHITESLAITPAILGEDVQIDGVIIACLERDTSDTNNDDAFMLEFDIHYLSDGNKTVDKNESGSGFIKS